MIIVTREMVQHLAQYGPYTVECMVLNATERCPNFSQETSDAFNRKAAQGGRELREQMIEVRRKLDFDLRQERTPAPFQSYAAALKFVTNLDAAIEQLGEIPA